MGYVGRRLDGSPHVARPRIDLLFLEPNPRQQFVVVVPARVGFFFAPWWDAAGDGSPRPAANSLKASTPFHSRCVGLKTQDPDSARIG